VPFQAIAHSSDGVIEAFTLREAGGGFLLALQWHPERIWQHPTSSSFFRRWLLPVDKAPGQLARRHNSNAFNYHLHTQRMRTDNGKNTTTGVSAAAIRPRRLAQSQWRLAVLK
jgi:hypothetical protein